MTSQNNEYQCSSWLESLHEKLTTSLPFFLRKLIRNVVIFNMNKWKHNPALLQRQRQSKIFSCYDHAFSSVCIYTATCPTLTLTRCVTNIIFSCQNINRVKIIRLGILSYTNGDIRPNDFCPIKTIAWRSSINKKINFR